MLALQRNHNVSNILVLMFALNLPTKKINKLMGKILIINNVTHS